MAQRPPPARPPRPPAALSLLHWNPGEAEPAQSISKSQTAGLTSQLANAASSNDSPTLGENIHFRSEKALPPLPLDPRKSPPGGIRGHAVGFKIGALGACGSAPSPHQGSPPAAGRQSSRRASLNSLCATGHNSSKKVKQLTGCNIDVDDDPLDRFFTFSSPNITTTSTSAATNKNTKNTKNNNVNIPPSCSTNNRNRRRGRVTNSMPHLGAPASAPISRMHQWRPSMDMDGGCGFFEVSESSSFDEVSDPMRIPSWISVDSNRSSTTGPSYLSEASSRSSIDDEELAFEIRAEEELKNERIQAAVDLQASAEYHMLVNEFTSGFGSLSITDDFLPPPEAPKSFQKETLDPSHNQTQKPPPRNEQPRHLQTNSQPPAPRSQPKEQAAQSHLSDNLPRIELPLGYDSSDSAVHQARGFSGRNTRRRAPPHAISPPLVAPAPTVRSAVDMPVTHSAFDSDSDDDDLDSSGKLREFKTWLANEASPLRNYYHENLEGRYRSPGSFVPSSATPHMVADKLIGSARGAVSKAKAKGFPRSSKRQESPMQIEFIGGGRVI